MTKDELLIFLNGKVVSMPKLDGKIVSMSKLDGTVWNQYPE